MASCAELALAAAQLQPPPGSAAHEHLSNPRLQHQVLHRAETAATCLDAALGAAAGAAFNEESSPEPPAPMFQLQLAADAAAEPKVQGCASVCVQIQL